MAMKSGRNAAEKQKKEDTIAMRFTIKDVAAKSGYTVATVSRALNNSDMVSSRAKKKIRAAAEELGYVKDSLAAGLATSSMPTVGVVVPDITNPYFPRLVKGIQDTLLMRGYTMFLCNSNEDIDVEIDCLKMLTGYKIRGIIMDPVSDESYKNLKWINGDIPVIFTANIPEGKNLNYISIDNYAAAETATRYLLSLGHKNITYVGGQHASNYTFRMRRKGFCDTMEAFLGAGVCPQIKEGFPSRQFGADATKEILASGKLPTAFFAGNDDIALGILEALWKHGFSVPKDISVIGIDNIEYASLPRIDLTTIEEPRYQIGKMAATEILNLFECSEQEGAKPIQKTLDHKLIIRKTCAKVKD